MNRLDDDDELPLSERRAQLKKSALTADGASYKKLEAGRPLIEQVNSNWQNEPLPYLSHGDQERELRFCDLEDDSSCPNATRDAVVSRRFRRMFIIISLVLGLLFWVWSWYLKPQFEDEWDLKQGFLGNNGTYGIARGGDFDGVWIQDLDAKWVPGGKHDEKRQRRLVFVGDIHGCAKELKALLRKIEFNEETDHLVPVGDVISKGPDNAGVVDELIRLQASTVRGNHEDRVLAMSPLVDATSSPSSAKTTSKGAAKDAATLRELSKHHLEYLRKMPLMLRIPALPQARKSAKKDDSTVTEEILVVHAGLVPALPLKRQDPYFVMNMRSIYTKTHLPLTEAKAEKGKSRPWHDVWSWYNDRLDKKKSLKGFREWQSDATETFGSGWFDRLRPSIDRKFPKPQVVVYGHHSRAGLQVDRWTKGLDTGCVNGGELTAMVLDAKGRTEIVSVGCENQKE